MQEEVQLVAVREVVVDEDVLSYGARASLEQVGSATGFVLALALLFAMLPRAARMRGAVTTNASRLAVAHGPSEDRDVVALEQRGLDAATATAAETPRV